MILLTARYAEKQTQNAVPEGALEQVADMKKC